MSLTALISGTPAAAYEVFKWVDEDGVTHFSESEPSAATTDVTRLVLATGNPTDYAPEADYYSIRNQAERTNEAYQRIEERRAARATKRAEAAERAAQTRAQTVTYYEPARRYAFPVVFHTRPHNRFHGLHRRPGIHPARHRSRGLDDFDRHRQPPPGWRPQEQAPANVAQQKLHWAPPRRAQ